MERSRRENSAPYAEVNKIICSPKTAIPVTNASQWGSRLPWVTVHFEIKLKTITNSNRGGISLFHSLTTWYFCFINTEVALIFIRFDLREFAIIWYVKSCNFYSSTHVDCQITNFDEIHASLLGCFLGDFLKFGWNYSKTFESVCIQK